MPEPVFAALLQDANTPVALTRVEPTIANIAAALGAEPSRLRALRHHQDLFIGVASGAVYSVRVCPLHTFTLRGPTLYFELKKKGTCIADAIDTSIAEHDYGLELAANSLAPEEGGHELLRFTGDEQTEITAVHHDLLAALDKVLGAEGVQLGGKSEPGWAKHIIGNMDEHPVGMNNFVESPAAVWAVPGHMPGPAAFVLSLLGWYIELVHNAGEIGLVDKDTAVELFQQTQALLTAIRPYHARRDRDKCEPVTPDDVRGTSAYDSLKAAKESGK